LIISGYVAIKNLSNRESLKSTVSFLMGNRTPELVAKYQSANSREAIDDLKPYQIINLFMTGENLTVNQTEKAKLRQERFY